MSMTIHTLKLSHNKMDDPGTAAFLEWLVKVKGGALKVLGLGGTGLSFPLIEGDHWKHLNGVEVLDLSDNRIEKEREEGDAPTEGRRKTGWIADLTAFFESTASLRRIDLSGTHLTPEQLVFFST